MEMRSKVGSCKRQTISSQSQANSPQPRADIPDMWAWWRMERQPGGAHQCSQASFDISAIGWDQGWGVTGAQESAAVAATGPSWGQTQWWSPAEHGDCQTQGLNWRGANQLMIMVVVLMAYKLEEQVPFKYLAICFLISVRPGECRLVISQRAVS